MASLAEDQLKANNIGPVELLPLLFRRTARRSVARWRSVRRHTLTLWFREAAASRTAVTRFGGLDKFSYALGERLPHGTTGLPPVIFGRLFQRKPERQRAEILASIPREGRPGLVIALKDERDRVRPLVVRLENLVSFPNGFLADLSTKWTPCIEADLREFVWPKLKITNGL